MSEEIIRRLAECERAIRAQSKSAAHDVVTMHISARGVTVRAFGSLNVPDADAPTIEEALCAFERNVSNLVNLPKTLGLEAAE